MGYEKKTGWGGEWREAEDMTLVCKYHLLSRKQG
jgi:hypothetical protein